MQLPYIALGIIILLFIILSIWFIVRPDDLPSKKGYAKDFYYYFEKLREANSEDSFLIITIEGTNDFIQYMCHDDEYLIDFPLFTERQKSKEESIKRIFDKLKLDYDENYTTDKEYKNLEIYLKITPNGLSDLSKKLFYMIFNTTNSTAFTFQWSNLDNNNTKK